MNPGDVALLGFAGGVAGAVNALAGGGTLLSFPALLAVGLPPVLANTTSSVGLVAGYGAGSLAYRRELVAQGARARGLLVSAVLGGAAGAVLLLALPGSAFRSVVPYLVLLGAALTGVQPALARRLRALPAHDSAPSWEVRILVGVLAAYGSYFGAGLGVVLLAALSMLLERDLQRANALKGLLSLVVNLVGALVFVLTGHVRWLAALVLAVGAMAGATVGVRLARRLPPPVIRSGVVLIGLAAGTVLLIQS